MNFVGFFQAGVTGFRSSVRTSFLQQSLVCPCLLNDVGIGATNVHIYEIYDIMLLLSTQECRGKLV